MDELRADGVGLRPVRLQVHKALVYGWGVLRGDAICDKRTLAGVAEYKKGYANEDDT